MSVSETPQPCLPAGLFDAQTSKFKSCERENVCSALTGTIYSNPNRKVFAIRCSGLMVLLRGKCDSSAVLVENETGR